MAVVRKQGIAHVGVLSNVPYIRLIGRGFDLSILGEDWEKILPFVQDDTFNPMVVPASACVGYLDPKEHFDSATLDEADRPFYERVLFTLQQLFPDDYPTSNL